MSIFFCPKKVSAQVCVVSRYESTSCFVTLAGSLPAGSSLPFWFIGYSASNPLSSIWTALFTWCLASSSTSTRIYDFPVFCGLPINRWCPSTQKILGFIGYLHCAWFIPPPCICLWGFLRFTYKPVVSRHPKKSRASHCCLIS